MHEVTQGEMCGIQVLGFYSKAVLHNLDAPPCTSHKKVSDGEDKQKKDQLRKTYIMIGNQQRVSEVS